jgi:hypothetical protein
MKNIAKGVVGIFVLMLLVFIGGCDLDREEPVEVEQVGVVENNTAGVVEEEKQLQEVEEEVKEDIDKDKEDLGQIIEGEITIGFSGDVTRSEANLFLENLGLSTRDELKSEIQVRELNYPPVLLEGLFSYLEEKSLIEECNVLERESARVKTDISSNCSFRSNISRNIALEAVGSYPGVGSHTEEDSLIIYWPDNSFGFLNYITVVIPSGEEKEWVERLLEYSEISSASVNYLTLLPVPGGN